MKTFYYTVVPRSLLLFSCSLILLLLPGCERVRSLMDRGSTPRLIGEAAPDFTVRDDARSLQLSSYRGQTVILNFWATWCPPCGEEAPSLIEMQHRLQGKVVVLGVCTSIGDSPRCDQDSYRRFLGEYKIDFFTIRDESNRSNGLYGTEMFPESYIIDSHGIVRRKIVGPVEWTKPDMLEYLQKIG